MRVRRRVRKPAAPARSRSAAKHCGSWRLLEVCRQDEAEGAIAPVPVDQRLGAAAEVNPLHGADDDPVAVAFDDFLDRAIDDGERVLEAPGAGGELPPSRAFVARRALDPAAPGEPIRQIADGARPEC